MLDFLYRGTIDEIDARFAYAVTTQVANAAILAHNCDPVSAHILGRGLTCAVLCIPMLKSDDERLTIRWNYDGALRSLVADVGAGGDVRGFVNPTNLSQLVDDKAAIYGESCQVSVVRSSSAAVLNSGTTRSILRNVSDDAAFFFSFSDQVETGLLSMIGFEANPERPVTLCQGFMLQALPGCDFERFDLVRERMKLAEVRELVANRPEADNYFERILDAVLGEHAKPEQVAVHECVPPRFECHCNQSNLGAVLRTLSAADREEIISNGKDIGVTCHFCSRRHVISPAQLRELTAGEGEE